MTSTRITCFSVLFALTACWPTAHVCGGTYHLSPTGDDARGDGSRQRPWKTLRHATSRLPDDGSTILLLDGLYVGSQSISRRFTRQCTVRAEHPYRATLRSSDRSNRVFSCYGGRNVVLRGLELVGSGASEGSYLVHVGTPSLSAG
ncbi:MAG: hypothetical protein ACYTG0_36815 [Planctomycetota bacterium]|jgi:hypothetical protein